MSKTKVLVALTVLFCGVALGVSAQTTANLDLVGTVGIDASITVETLTAAGTMDLTATQTALHVANMTYHSNNAAGFTVSVDSANGFTLLGDAGGGANNFLAYSLRVGTGTPITADGTAITSTGPQLTDVTQALYVAYTGSTALYADTYRDSLTFTITAN